MEGTRPQPRPQAARRNAWPAAIIVAAAALGIGAWVVAWTRGTPALAARRPEIIAYMTLGGPTVAPPTAVATLKSPYHTMVKKVHVTLNQRVRRGELLVELVIPSADMALQSARQAVRDAEANYEAARRASGTALSSARQQLDAARAAERAARGGGQSAAPANGQGSDASTGDTGSGGTGATSSGTAPSVTITPAVDLPTAIAQRQAAEQAVAEAQSGAAASLAPAREQLEQARAALKDAEAGRTQGMIRAPMTGNVVVLNAADGQTVGEDANKPLVQVVDLYALQVQAALSPAQLPHAPVGTPVELRFQQLPSKVVPGKITRITSVPDQQGRVTGYTAIVDFDNRRGQVQPNWPASVAIRLAEAHNVVAVPNDAVQKGDHDQTFVEVRRGGRWQKVPVVVGVSDGTYTEIRQGIQEGEEVKVTPPLLGR